MIKSVMKNKRGSHVGVIASFSIFVLFLISLYLIVEPTVRTQKDKKLILDYIELKLKEEFSANFTTAIIANSSQSNGVCVSFDKNVAGVVGQNSYVENKNGEYIQSNNSNPNYLLAKWEGNEGFIKMFFSGESFDNLPATSCSNVSNNFAIKSITNEKQVFESKIVNGIINFETLKNTMNISEENDWNLGFVYNNETAISSGTVDSLREIYAQEIPITYVNKSASLLTGKLVVSIW